MTAIQIKIMLHYYVFLTDYEGAEHVDLIDTTRKHFVDLELLRALDPRTPTPVPFLDQHCPQYTITPKGKAFVEMLKAVPVPEVQYEVQVQYVDPRFEK